MQLMSWMIARLGSRFGLLFEPYQRRVMHSALGRFLDRPLDLMVGLEEPDGTRRVLPFTTDGQLLTDPEQFERINSITFRGYSEKYNLRFEFNVHSVFYPQDERLCLLPAMYLEMRVNPVDRVRWHRPVGPTPSQVKLFIRLRRPQTQITAHPGQGQEPAYVDLSYRCSLTPQIGASHPAAAAHPQEERFVEVRERIVSLNPECTCLEDDAGLVCQLPVTEEGSGIKWRLVWAAHVAEPVLEVAHAGQNRPARLRYTQHWSNLEEVLDEAIRTRDDRLALSRRFEKLLEQAPLDGAQRHLLNQGFQNWLSNTFWCQFADDQGSLQEWFSVWEGTCLYHSTIDAEYNASLAYLSLWPQLLAMQLTQWAQREQTHEASTWAYLPHDLGWGTRAVSQGYPHAMEVEESCNFLLLLQAYTHWTGDKTYALSMRGLVERLAQYLIWVDRDQSGFASEGVDHTIGDDQGLAPLSRRQTSLAVKRAAALRGAAVLLTIAGDGELSQRCEEIAEADLQKIERQAWLADHYAVSVEAAGPGPLEPWGGAPLGGYERVRGWDAYSIYTSNALLLPMLIGQPPLLEEARVRKDIISTMRENLSRYGCGHTSLEPESIWVSQNLWRDHMARYLGMAGGLSAQHYWDLQLASNTFQQSLGYVDTYINNNLAFHPRGVTAMGYLLAGPRLIIDRLAAGGVYITVDPDRDRPQRWPLLPLADWRAGKIPVCVVDEAGRVTIEGKIDPVIIHGSDPTTSPTSAGLIG